MRSGSGWVLALAMAIGVLAVPGGASVQRVLGEAHCAAILAVGEDFADTETLDQLQSADLKAASKGFASSATQVDDADVKRALKKISKT